MRHVDADRVVYFDKHINMYFENCNILLGRCGHCPWMIHTLYLIAHGEYGPTGGIDVLYSDVMTSIFVILFSLTFSHLSCLLTCLGLTEA